MKKPSAQNSGNESALSARSAQERFLNQMIKERKKVALFLVNGIRIEAQIESFDDYVILIKGAMAGQVYKHAVSTIQPVTGGGLEVTVRAPKESTRQPTIVRRRRPGLFKREDDGNER